MRLLLALLFSAFVCTATPTTITDTLLQPFNNLPAAGVDISVTQAAFFSGSTYYPAWTLTPHPATDANGLFSFALEPNPAGQLYVVTMKQSNGVITSSCWNVPASGSPVNIQTVLSTACATPPLSIVQLGQLAQGGAVQGNVITWNNTLKRWEADAPTGGGVTVAQIQTNALVCAGDTGSDGSRYVIAVSPAPAQPLTRYATFCFLAANASLFRPTLNVNGSGDNMLLTQAGLAVDTDYIISGQTVFVNWNDIYNGWMIISGLAAAALTGVDIDTSNQIVATHLAAALPVNQGGTGAQTLAVHGPLIGAGTGPVVAGSPGTSGQCYTSNGASADPTFQACPSGGGGSALPGPHFPFGRSAGYGRTLAFAGANEVDMYSFPVYSPGWTFTSSGSINEYFYSDGTHTAFAIYDSTGALIANSTTATRAGSGASIQAKFAWGGSFTLAAGQYYLAWTGDTTAPQIYTIADVPGIVGAADNQTPAIYFKCANASTGTSTLAFPATCGAQTSLGVGPALPPYAMFK